MSNSKSKPSRRFRTKFACGTMIIVAAMGLSGCIIGGGGGNKGAAKAIQEAAETWSRSHGYTAASVDISKAGSKQPSATVKTEGGKEFLLELSKELGREAPHANEYRVDTCEIIGSTSGVCSDTEP